MKTTRVKCGEWSVWNNNVELAESLFGPPGTQANRRWFYRYNTKFLQDWDPHQNWRRKGRTRLELVLYFRNSTDAAFFCLKQPQI